MSKFVELSETKRIQRLQSIRSSITSKSNTRTKQQHGRERSKVRKINNGDFQLRNLCGASARTKSGLKLTVSDSEAASISSARRKSSVSKRNNINLGRSNRKENLSEGKENWSPSNSAEAIRIFRKKAIREENNATHRDAYQCKKKDDAVCAIKYGSSKGSRQKLYQEPHIRRSVESSSQPRGQKSKTQVEVSKNRGMKVGSTRNNNMRTVEKVSRLKAEGKSRKPYVSRGVTVESLQKERNDAINILKEIDDANLIGKMSEMQIAMDTMGGNQISVNQQHMTDADTNLVSESGSHRRELVHEFDSISSRKSYLSENESDDGGEESDGGTGSFYSDSFDTSSNKSVFSDGSF